MLKTVVQKPLKEMNRSLGEMIHVTAGQGRNLNNVMEMPKANPKLLIIKLF
jgi:hypothetical protein